MSGYKFSFQIRKDHEGKFNDWSPDPSISEVVMLNDNELGPGLNGIPGITNFKVLIYIYAHKHTIDDLQKTLNGVMNNLLTLGIPTVEVGLVIIFDGLEDVDDSIIKDYELMRNTVNTKLQEIKKKLIKDRVSFDPKLLEEGALVHISVRRILEFENLSSEQTEQRIEEREVLYRPRVVIDAILPIIFCFKYYHGGKIDSHKWFLKGFCKTFKTEYLIMLECGVFPEENSLNKFIEALVKDDSMGAVCGYMKLYMQPVLDDHSQRIDHEWFDKLDYVSQMCDKVFSIQEAQNYQKGYEYIYLKPAESLINYVQTIPSVFCAYKWSKSFEDPDVMRLFLNEGPNNTGSNDFKIEHEYLNNEYQVGLMLFSKGYNAKYLPNAKVRLAPAIHLVDLMSQRKVPIISEWFSMYGVLHFLRNSKVKLSCFRYFVFRLLQISKFIKFLFSSFVLGSYLVYLDIVTSQYFSQYSFLNFSTAFTKLNELIFFIYICMLGSMIFYSILYKVRDRPEKFYRASNFLGIFMLLSFAFGLYKVIDYLINENYRDMFDLTIKFYEPTEGFDRREIRCLVIVNIITHLVPCFFNIYFIIKDLIFSFHQYIFYFPTFAHNISLYAFCNMDIIDDPKSKNDQKKIKKYREDKMKWVFYWILSNIAYTFVLIELNSVQNYRINFIRAVLYLYSCYFIILSVASLVFNIKYYTFDSLPMGKYTNTENLDTLIRRKKFFSDLIQKGQTNRT